MTRLPRLMDQHLSELCRLHPVSVQICEQLAPLSTAEMTLPPDVPAAVRQFAELYTAEGTQGIFRISAITREDGGTQRVSLQHGLTTLSDGVIPGEGEVTESARSILTRILAGQSGDITWALGDVEAPEDKLLTFTWEQSNRLESLTRLMTQLPAYMLETDQTALPWVLHLRAMPTAVTCEARLHRNLTSYTFSTDDSDLCTCLLAPGFDAPFRVDSPYGEVTRTLQADDDLSADAIREQALAYLEQYAEPTRTVTLSAVDLSIETGLPIDHFRRGGLCRLCLPEENVTFTARIVSISHDDPLNRAAARTVTLSSEAATASSAIAGLSVDMHLVKAWYARLEKQVRIEAETIDMIAERITLLAEEKQVDEIATRLKQVEIDLNAAEAALTLKAAASDMASAMLRLSGLESEILLKADKVDIEGFLTVNDGAYVAGMLSGNDIDCEILTVNSGIWAASVNAFDVDSTSVTTSSLNVVGEDVQWREAEVVTDVNVHVTKATTPPFYNANGTMVTSGIEYVSSVSLTPVTTTIKYLGV